MQQQLPLFDDLISEQKKRFRDRELREGQVKRRRATSRKPAKTRQATKAKRGTASKPARNRRVSALSKDTEVARLARELAEAREQQTATSEILGAVARSSTDVQVVLDAICASAARLCEAYDSTIWRPDGDRLVPAAHHGPIAQVGSLPLTREYPASLAFR